MCASGTAQNSCHNQGHHKPQLPFHRNSSAKDHRPGNTIRRCSDVPATSGCHAAFDPVSQPGSMALATKELQLQAAVSLATAGVPLNDGHLVHQEQRWLIAPSRSLKKKASSALEKACGNEACHQITMDSSARPGASLAIAQQPSVLDCCVFVRAAKVPGIRAQCT